MRKRSRKRETVKWKRLREEAEEEMEETAQKNLKPVTNLPRPVVRKRKERKKLLGY